jgi:ParB family chromosome partitioning protein
MQVEEQQNWTDFTDEIEETVIEELTPSPFNTRTVIQDDKLRELADSIRRIGVQQPIIIREVPVEDDVVDLEIICGHRRVEASKLAGRTTIPTIARDLSDEEARELQITENLQREDLPPLEEARAFNEAMTLAPLKMLSAQELAARLGKSPVYINRRLTLLDLIPAAQEALSKGLIDIGHALELARLADDQQQRLVYWLGVVEEKDDPNDEDESFEDDEDEGGSVLIGDQVKLTTSRSVLDLRRHIAQTTLQVLEKAPFDPNDHLLYVEAGSCANCLKRTGASPQLFSDIQGDDICTDRSCFDGKVKAHIAKVKAHIAQQLATAKASKTPLHQITTKYGSKGADIHYAYNTLRETKGKPCGTSVTAIYIDGSDIGKTVEICVGDGCKVHGGGSSRGSSVQNPKEKEKRKALLAKIRVEKDYRLALFKELMARPMDPVPTDLMVKSLVAFALGKVDSTKYPILTETLGWHKDTFGWQQRAKGPLAMLTPTSQAEAVRIALVALEAHELTVHEHDFEATGKRIKTETGLERMARMIGVDPAAVRARFEPKAAQTPKKAAPKKTAAKKAAPAKKSAKKGRR